MKLVLFLLLQSILLVSAQADQGLEERAREERKWRPVEIWSPTGGKSLLGTGYVTQNKEWRLDRVSERIDLGEALESSFASQYGVVAFREYCQRTKYGFSVSSTYNRPYSVILSLPKWNEALAPLKGPQKMNLRKVQLMVQFRDDSFTNKYSNFHTKSIERELNEQVKGQIENLSKVGSVRLDLTGRDSVACDFVEGRVELGLEATWDYSAAKLNRVPTVGEREVSQVIERSKAIPLGARDCEGKKVLASALFATNLTTAIYKNVPTIGAGPYLDAFHQSFDTETCEWQSADQINHAEIASAFDELSEKQVQGVSYVRTRFDGEIK